MGIDVPATSEALTMVIIQDMADRMEREEYTEEEIQEAVHQCLMELMYV